MNNFNISSCSGINPNRAAFFKPNEDYLIEDDLHYIYILLDGVTRNKINGKYPNPSPSAIVSKLFGDEVHKKLLEYINSDYFELLKNSIFHANKKIRNYNQQQNNWSFLPGTVGIISIIKDGTFYYAYNGDCSGRLIRNSNIYLFTHSQTERIHKHLHEFSSDYIRNEIVNNKKHPYCYGVFNGQPQALDLIEYGKLELQAGDKLILASDGLNPFFDSKNTAIIAETTPQHIIESTIQIESSSTTPKRSDDKAVIIINIH